MADDPAAPDDDPVDTADTADAAAVTSETAETGEADESTEDTEVAEAGTGESTGSGQLRRAAIISVVVVVVLAGLVGWLGWRAYESHRTQQQRDTFLSVGRQAALNLTTVDWEHAEADVQRVLDSATGTFYDDFQKRAEPFTEVVKQAKSKSVGSIDEAAVESASDHDAKVLVAVSIKTSNAGAPEQAPQHWRMQLTMQKIGDEVKVSNVEFVE